MQCKRKKYHGLLELVSVTFVGVTGRDAYIPHSGLCETLWFLACVCLVLSPGWY